jgi:uncharacterized protein involved in exopolysaccharide biosynthesis
MLRFRELQLRSVFDLQNSLYTSLSQQLETAQLSAVRDTPIMSVLIPPVPPTEKSFPQRTASVIIAFLFGVSITFAWILLDMKLRVASSMYPSDVSGLTASWLATRTEIRRLVRGVLHRS